MAAREVCCENSWTLQPEYSEVVRLLPAFLQILTTRHALQRPLRIVRLLGFRKLRCVLRSPLLSARNPSRKTQSKNDPVFRSQTNLSGIHHACILGACNHRLVSGGTTHLTNALALDFCLRRKNQRRLKHIKRRTIPRSGRTPKR